MEKLRDNGYYYKKIIKCYYSFDNELLKKETYYVLCEKDHYDVWTSPIKPFNTIEELTNFVNECYGCIVRKGDKE